MLQIFKEGGVEVDREVGIVPKLKDCGEVYTELEPELRYDYNTTQLSYSFTE